MTHLGKCLAAKEVKPIVNFQHRFATTYLYGSYSPINGDCFVWEIDGVSTTIFESYLKHFSLYKPEEYKIIVIDNAGFHATKNIEIPDNIFLLRIPPYAPELNPCEQIWQYIKNRYKNKRFENMEILKNWLHEMVKSMDANLIKSITSNSHYTEAFYATLYIQIGIIMYSRYYGYYGKQIGQQALRDGIRYFMYRSLTVYLDMESKIEVTKVLEDTASFLRSSLYTLYHKKDRVPLGVDREQMLFEPIERLLKDLKRLMDPYFDFTIVAKDHTCGRLLEELPKYIARMDERIRQEQQEDTPKDQ